MASVCQVPCEKAPRPGPMLEESKCKVPSAQQNLTDLGDSSKEAGKNLTPTKDDRCGGMKHLRQAIGLKVIPVHPWSDSSYFIIKKLCSKRALSQFYMKLMFCSQGDCVHRFFVYILILRGFKKFIFIVGHTGLCPAPPRDRNRCSPSCLLEVL